MANEIEKLSERDFQRGLERGPVGRSPAKQALAGALATAGSAAVIAAFPKLAVLVLAPLYVTAVVGLIVTGHAAASWLRRRRHARLNPPVPPARLLPGPGDPP